MAITVQGVQVKENCLIILRPVQAQRNEVLTHPNEFKGTYVNNEFVGYIYIYMCTHTHTFLASVRITEPGNYNIYYY
jgi:hypothetical protein